MEYFDVYNVDQKKRGRTMVRGSEQELGGLRQVGRIAGMLQLAVGR